MTRVSFDGIVESGLEALLQEQHRGPFGGRQETKVRRGIGVRYAEMLGVILKAEGLHDLAQGQERVLVRDLDIVLVRWWHVLDEPADILESRERPHDRLLGLLLALARRRDLKNGLCALHVQDTIAAASRARGENALHVLDCHRRYPGVPALLYEIRRRSTARIRLRVALGRQTPEHLGEELIKALRAVGVDLAPRQLCLILPVEGRLGRGLLLVVHGLADRVRARVFVQEPGRALRALPIDLLRSIFTPVWESFRPLRHHAHEADDDLREFIALLLRLALEERRRVQDRENRQPIVEEVIEVAEIEDVVREALDAVPVVLGSGIVDERHDHVLDAGKFPVLLVEKTALHGIALHVRGIRTEIRDHVLQVVVFGPH